MTVNCPQYVEVAKQMRSIRELLLDSGDFGTIFVSEDNLGDGVIVALVI